MRRFSTSEYLQAAIRAGVVAPFYLLRPYLGRAHIERFQFARIRQLIAHAYKESRFYREKYDSAGVHPNDFSRLSDLTRFPSVTKNELIGAIESGDMRPTGHSIESISSGSSGQVIRVSHNVKHTHAYAVGRYRILNMARNYSPLDRTLYVYTSEFPARSLFGLYRSWFISTLNDISDTIRQMKKIRPQILCIYPSHLLEIVRHLKKEEGRDLRLKLISLNSEMSSLAQRESMEDFFGCPVLDEYSTEELGWVAAECPQKNYHVWEDMAFIETLDPTSDERHLTGEITGTNLQNFETPFIRYRQGDLGSLQMQACGCGRKTLQLTNLLGRQNDSFVLQGQVFTPAYLLDMVYNLLLVDRLPISDFCLIQDNLNSVVLQIIPRPGAGANLATEARRSLQKFFPPGIGVSVQLTKQLLKTLTGKRNPIISMIRKP